MRAVRVLLKLTSVMSLAGGAVPAVAEDIRLTQGGLTLAADRNISCAAPPVLRVEGGLRAAFGDGRAADLNALLAQMGAGIAQACPDVSTLSVEGTDGAVSFRFEVSRDAGWAVALGAPTAPVAPGLGGAAAPSAPVASAPSAAAVAAPVPAPTPAPAAQPLVPRVPLASFLPLRVDQQMRGDPGPLTRAALALRPDLFSRPEIIEQIFQMEGRSFLSQNTRASELAQFATEYQRRPVPVELNLMLLHRVTFSSNDYAPDLGAYDLRIGNGRNGPGPVMQIPIQPLPNQRLVLTTETFPSDLSLRMDPAQAQLFAQTHLPRGSFSGYVASYVELTNLRFEATRGVFEADMRYFGSELRSEARDAPGGVGPSVYAWQPEAPSRAPAGGGAGLPVAELARLFGAGATRLGAYLTSDEGNARVFTQMTMGRLLNARPDLLEDDLTALRIASVLLTPTERQILFLENIDRDFRQLNVFQRRDLANRVRSEFADRMRGRHPVGPIPFVHVERVQLGEYDFASGSFPLPEIRLARDVLRNRYATPIAGTELRLDDVVLPRAMPADEAGARQLVAFLQNRGDPGLYLAITGTIGAFDPDRADFDALGETVGPSDIRVRLFGDAALTQEVIDFTPALTALQAQVDESARLLSEPVTAFRDVLAGIDRLTPDVPVMQLMANTLVQGDDLPPSTRAANVEAARAWLDQGQPPAVYRLSGEMQLGPYDPVTGLVPVLGLGLGYPGTPEDMRFRSRYDLVFDPALTSLTLAPEEGARIDALRRATGGGFVIRVEAEMARAVNDGSPGSLRLRAQMRPLRLSIFGNGQRAEDRVLLAELQLAEPGAAFTAPAAGADAPASQAGD